MAAVADTAEGSGEAKNAKLNAWLTENKLSSLLNNDRFMEQELTLQDLGELDDDELNEFTKDDRLNLGVMEQKKFKKAVKKLRGNNPQKSQNQPQASMRIKIIMSEAEENAMENVGKEEKKLEQYIENVKELIKNTKNNAKNCQNIIDQEFSKMAEILNKRKSELEQQLKDIKNKKLKIYNDNLAKAMSMNKELKDVQIEWDGLLGNTDINKGDRKNKITSESKNILIKSKNVLKNEVIHSVNDIFNAKFSSTQNYKYISNVGRIDGNEAVPELSVTKISGNIVDINIELKTDDDILLYGLQCKERKGDDNDENIFNEDAADEKKDELSEYLEFKDSKYVVRNLKFESNYSVRVKVKLSKTVWTNYSNIQHFKTKKKFTWILDSKILTDPNEIAIFKNLLTPQLKAVLNKEKISVKLLYRNSRDGNSSKAFHNKCNGHPNTIILVHSDYDHIFGGFAAHKWCSSGGYVKDDDAFLFLVRSAFNHQPRIYKNVKKDGLAVCDHSKYGPTFGGGHDLALQVNGNNSRHYSYPGSQYEGTGNVLSGGETHTTDRASHLFNLKEYEVFVVT